MTSVWCVRADFGTYTEHFVKGGYVGIGWLPNTDLSHITARDEIYPLYRAAYPDDTSNIVIGQQVGQVARFLLDLQAGDYVITPTSDTDWLCYGQLSDGPSYYYTSGNDGCPYRHRRRVTWSKHRLRRADFSVPFQNTLRSLLAIFGISQRDEFLVAINVRPSVARTQAYDPYRAVLDQLLQLDAKEFEILVGYLLTALGFEGSEVTGKSGDGGVDAIGELNVGNLARVKVFVQAKRYQLGATISAGVVRQLRQAIPFGGQGAFITTADFQKAAHNVALEPGFPRIGLVNGRQLVDLLVEHWDDIPQEFRDRLGLRPGLVHI